MNHRHLLPNEIDLLLDGEVGFGVAPLRAHARECAQCRAELEEGRRVVEALDRMPRFSPAVGFADRVMAQVQVFEPWHVTVADRARRFVPRSRPARVLVAAMAASVAVVLSVTTLWLAARLDLFVFTMGVAGDYVRGALLGFLGSVVAAAFGGPAAEALRASGAAGAALAAGTLVLLILTTLGGLRALVAAASRRRA